GGPSRRGGPGRGGGRDERDRLALEQEGGRGQREDAPPAVPVLQRHGAFLVADDGAAEPALGILDHQAALRLDLRHLALAGSPALELAVRSEHVCAILPAPHRYLLRSWPRTWSYLRASVAEGAPPGAPPTRAIAACAGGLPSACGSYPGRHRGQPGLGLAGRSSASLSRAGNLPDAIDLALGDYECQGGERVLDERKLTVLRAIVEDYVS